MSTSTNREAIRFNALRNALYHTSRRRSLERWNRVFNFLVVVLGAATVGDTLTSLGLRSQWIGMSVAVIGALQLVFDYGRQARDHQTLQRDYYSLLAEIEAKLTPSPEECATWQSKLIRITADEPPTLRAIDSKAYNDALDATDSFDQGQRLIIPFLHRVFGGLFAFEGHRYVKLCELPPKP